MSGAPGARRGGQLRTERTTSSDLSWTDGRAGRQEQKAGGGQGSVGGVGERRRWLRTGSAMT